MPTKTPRELSPKLGVACPGATPGALGQATEGARARRGRRAPRAKAALPPPVRPSGAELECKDGWGFSDSHFEWTSRRAITQSGDRYPLCRQELTRIIPWIEGVMGIAVEPESALRPSYPPPVRPSRLERSSLRALERILSPQQLSLNPLERLRHGHGQSHAEVYAVRYGGGIRRVPDAVVWPESEEQVARLVQLAAERDLVLVPFGGGTNVTEALLCPDGEARSIVAVDLRLLNRLLWIDPVSRMARIEAGAVGRQIAAVLAERGHTMGHEPDSLEFSTLGGWIATNASGMKKNRYGNIEDLIVDMNVVTPHGIFARDSLVPRESVGFDLRKLMFGSEGALGIVTSAVVKVFPLPEEQSYGSFVFPTFEDGVGFMYELAQSGDVPASVRLVDNLQFQFGQMLKADPKPAQAVKSQLEKLYLTRLRGFDPTLLAACTLVHEGTRQKVSAERRHVELIAARHHGISAGPANGARGYQLTFGIAYLRDFIMRHEVIADSFETSVPWARALDLCDRVKRRVVARHRELGLPGRPFVTCRVTQIYATGVCVYFYLGIPVRGVEDPTAAFATVERAAREEILAAGGSLSHHHGIGKHRQDDLGRIMSGAQLDLRRQVKLAFDPGEIFAVGNQALEPPARKGATRHDRVSGQRVPGRRPRQSSPLPGSEEGV
jgi:alkyldihydroxyacetonephosphate synthase